MIITGRMQRASEGLIRIIFVPVLVLLSDSGSARQNPREFIVLAPAPAGPASLWPAPADLKSSNRISTFTTLETPRKAWIARVVPKGLFHRLYIPLLFDIAGSKVMLSNDRRPSCGHASLHISFEV